MNSKSVFYSMMDELRSLINQESYTKVIVTTAYIFWSAPEESIRAMQLGEQKLQDYCLREITPLKMSDQSEFEVYQDVKLMNLFKSYQQLYEELKKNRDQFAQFIAEGIFTGITINYHEVLDSNSTANLMSEIGKKYPTELVYDGAMGFGRMLYLLNPKQFIAKEINDGVAQISRLLFTMLGRNAEIKTEDSLLCNDQSYGADLTISQPPFGLRVDRDAYKNSPYLMISDQLPSSGGDSLWIQEGLYQTHENGRVIMQIAPGWFYRGGYDLALRRELVDKNWIEAVIYLPDSMLSHTAIETNILILNKAKTTSTITLINAKSLGEKDRFHRQFSDDEIQQVVEALDQNRETAEDESFVKRISIMDLIKNDYDLNENLYFKKKLSLEVLSIEEEQETLKWVTEEHNQLQNEFTQLLKDLKKSK